MQTWRLIPLLDAPGHVQMALDSWLLTQHLQGKQPATLRFYTWKPAAISLGYHQHHWAKHWQQVTWQGAPLALVRRPTGGRAVLHQGDLTYSVVTSGLPTNRLQAYKTLCEFLVRGWRSLGVELQYGQVERGYLRNPNCFGTATGADLVLADGSKLIGSAQLRQGSGALQHGSMPLFADSALFQQVFGVLPQRPSLPLALTPEALVETVMQALIAAAGECFAADLHVQPLSDEEWEAVLTHAWEEGKGNRKGE
ncbi:lipoate--protein ligase family protein [Stenomitos frigidus]|uniref:Biotin--protein ligase n=1 Tax=Stenomitos frigidus ULC18 TaxID=2107698 RepID=A0A2T1E1A9_9CYAN|nr:biotin/lipoate A/B protein ligase family protein [Stenomitos frigidus]PSB26500.1 biotin--protein ligase [Stenomitos frigidus ULC18]